MNGTEEPFCADVPLRNYSQLSTYVGKPSAVGQPTRSTHPFGVDKLVVGCNLSLWRRHLVNAYEVKAGIVVIAGKTV